MTVVLLWSALAWAEPLVVDLDGDGVGEQVVSVEGEVKIGAHAVPCEGFSLCAVAAHDIVAGDGQREVEVCDSGPRDDTYCSLYTVRGGALARIAFSDDSTPSTIRTSGSGIVLTQGWAHRLYTRIDKYIYRAGRLEKVAQPFYAAGATVHVDRTFPVFHAPDSGVVVANVRPDSDITVVVEHGDKEGWLLLKLSSGITGWVQVDDLVGASDHYIGVMGAG